MTLDYRNVISIVEIIVYVPCLAITIALAIRHGFNRNSGWLFLIIFSLTRILGPVLQLVTISQPRDISLYVGYAILQGVGFSPLELAALGLLSRCITSIQKSTQNFKGERLRKITMLVIIVGFIMSIIGGVNAGNTFAHTGVFQPVTLSKVATYLFIASYIGLVVITLLTARSISHNEPGEKRLLVAVVASLPFLLVRLAYSSLSTLTTNPSFNIISGNVTVLLCMALIEEFVVVACFLAVGLTLRRLPKVQYVEATGQVNARNAGNQQIKHGLELRELPEQA